MSLERRRSSRVGACGVCVRCDFDFWGENVIGGGS